MTLMNGICDISRFAVVVFVPYNTSTTLENHFIQHILMKFGLYHLDILDDGNLFKGVFIIMCQACNLNDDILAKRNNKRHTVEYLCRFLNNSVTIGAEERVTNDIFVPTSIATGYSCNYTPIDGTDILRSIPAIGRELYVNININFDTISKMTQNNAHAALEYLKLTKSSRYISCSIIKILIDEC